MGDISVGDFVYDETGNRTKVVACSPVTIGSTCYLVTFSDGAEIVADENHQWLTLSDRDRISVTRTDPKWRAKRRANRPSRGHGGRPDLAERNRLDAIGYLPKLVTGSVKTTSDIARTVHVRGRVNHSIAVASPLSCEQAPLPIDPYLLGAWLGDGTSASARICMAEPEMVRLVTEAVSTNGWEVTKGSTRYDYGIRGGFSMALANHKLLKAKHIPREYLRASIDQRIALIQGLMDTDGYVDNRGQCEFTNTNETLAIGTAELIRTLGCKASISIGVATLKGRAIGPKYRIKFLAPFPAFRLQRKLSRQKMSGFRPTVARRYIESVTRVDSVPVKCIQVDSPSRLYLAGYEMVPTHNSEMGLGLAFTAHKQTLFLRRQYTDLGALTERAIKINRTKKGFNGSPPPKLRTQDGRMIEFGAVQRPGDEESFQGRPHDLIVFDEAVQFLESQVRFLITWNRTTDQDQRCRVVMASNPPVGADGEWIIRFFAPWLDPTHPNPAKPGELRWYVTDEDSKDREVTGPEPVRIGLQMAKPLSRTFIPAKLADNPFLSATGEYAAKLDSLPEPYRSAFRDGNFMLARKDAINQLIPSAWIREAQSRWSPQPPPGTPMCAIGVDVAQGGEDETVLAIRHDGWFDNLIRVPGARTPTGPDVAGLVISRRRDNAVVVIDMGGGYGGSAYDHLKGNLYQNQGWNAQPSVFGYKGVDGSMARTADGQLGFVNKRSEVYWKFREALDPAQVGGSPISLPPDPMLVSDLAALTFEVTARGVKVRNKDEVMKDLGRSPDGGDAVAICWSEGQKAINNGLLWNRAHNNVVRIPTVKHHRDGQRAFVRR